MDLAVLDHLDDLLLDRLPDPLELLRAAVEREPRDRAGRLADPRGRPPVRCDPEPVRALADGAELVLEMDCDFSHEPADVPRLIAAAESGADLVLGSRYVPGGSIPNWGLLRRAISLGGNVYAQIWLQSRIRDLTGGFK